MTCDEARKAAAVMFAYAEGKPIQCKCKSDTEWRTCAGYLGFDWTVFDYRIKPEVVRYKRVIYQPKNSQPLLALCYTDNAVAEWKIHPYFVRFIDTEWQEVEV